MDAMEAYPAKQQKSWTESKVACNTMKPFHDLCPYDLLCPGGPGNIPLRGMTRDEESIWIPIVDDENEWINLNDKSLKCTKITHVIDQSTDKPMGKPSWGKAPGAEWPSDLSFTDNNEDPPKKRPIAVRPLCCRPAHFEEGDPGHCAPGYRLDRAFRCAPRECRKPSHCTTAERDPSCFDATGPKTAPPQHARCAKCEGGYELDSLKQCACRGAMPSSCVKWAEDCKGCGACQPGYRRVDTTTGQQRASVFRQLGFSDLANPSLPWALCESDVVAKNGKTSGTGVKRGVRFPLKFSMVVRRKSGATVQSAIVRAVADQVRLDNRTNARTARNTYYTM
jgi:hypothetical protein